MSLSDFADLDHGRGPVLFVVCGILIGLIFEKIVLKGLRRFIRRTNWEGDEIILASLKGFPFVFFTILGIYFAMKYYLKDASHFGFLEKSFTVILIFLATAAFARISSGLVQIYSQRVTTGFLSTSIFGNLTGVLAFLIGSLMILQFLNISITPILTALGVVGIAIALALQDTVANLFAGIHIIATQQVKSGDYIRLSSGEEGYVMDVTWRYSHIKALSNSMTIIPNATLAKTIVTNYDRPDKELAVLVQVGVSYDSDLEKVEAVTLEVARGVMQEIEGGVAKFDPSIRYHTFGDFSIGFTVVMHCRQFTDQYLIKHEFIKRLHRSYKKDGILIPSDPDHSYGTREQPLARPFAKELV
jgi:small-conductance mechanosensitive channel